MKTFKFAILALSVAGLMSSCTKMYYQIAQTKPVDPAVIQNDNDDSGYYYEDRNCRITYDFWSENGDASFTVYNKTDQILYIDMTKTFYIKNGVSTMYYAGRTWTETQAAANDHRSSATSTQYAEQPVVAVAPHSYQTFGNYAISKFVILDCDLNRKPLKNEPATIAYNSDNTPTTFGNYITYRVGEKGTEQVVKHMFYVSRVTNYLETDLIKNEVRKTCKNVSANGVESESVKIINFAPATGYYHKYMK